MAQIIATSLPFKYTCINKAYAPGMVPQRGPLATSTYLNPLSGRFVFFTSSTYRVALSGDTTIAGWVDEVNNSNSTGSVAGDDAAIIDDLNAVFEIPCTGATLTATNLLSTYQHASFDLATAGSALTLVQSVNLAGTSQKVVRVVGGNVTRQTVFVKINPAKLQAQ
ncbi:MAG: hypothetical protein ABSE82_07420 [Nitrososphaerales archaeon]|jgi:hypothetical protein